MKKKVFSISLFLVILVFSFNVFAQQVISWEIKQHSTDIESLEAEVTAYTNNGYVPLGITYDNRELYILYVQDPDFGMEAWLLEWYDSRDSLQNGITGNMNQGYIPTGLTYTGDLFYVLYVLVDSSATAWQLVPSATDLKAVEQAINPYVSQGYVPVGITFYQDEYWTLLLEIPTTTVKRYLIEEYKVGTQTNSINANIQRGYVPWGLEYSGKDRIDILYVSFN